MATGLRNAKSEAEPSKHKGRLPSLDCPVPWCPACLPSWSLLTTGQLREISPACCLDFNQPTKPWKSWDSASPSSHCLTWKISWALRRLTADTSEVLPDVVPSLLCSNAFWEELPSPAPVFFKRMKACTCCSINSLSKLRENSVHLCKITSSRAASEAFTRLNCCSVPLTLGQALSCIK